jgi:uncharacterized protein (TIGR03437 family)
MLRPIALLAILVASTFPAFTQISGVGQSLTCTSNAPTVPTLRATGLTEQIGDILITCVGGAVTDGAPAPQVNITVVLTSQITTRLTNANGVSEALLFIDEPTTGGGPVPAYGPNAPFIPCPNPGPMAPVGCAAFGYNVSTPGGVYTIQTAAQAAGADPTTTGGGQAPNVYQGWVIGTTVTFFGVPVLSPGTNGTRVYRITNVRTNASVFTAGQSVSAVVQTSNPSALPIADAEPIVGFVQTTPAVQIIKPDLSGPAPLALDGCLALNPALALNPSSTTVPDGVSFVVRLSETSKTDFKPMGVPASPPPDVNSRPPAAAEDIPGFNYGTETSFYNPGFPAINGLNVAGLATQGTRFLIQFQGLPAGMQIHAPVYERGKGLTTSRVRLISTNPDGSSLSYTPLGPLSSLNTYFTSTMVYVYEVTEIAGGVDPNAIDTIDLPFYMAYPGPAALPTNTGQVTVNVSPAPFSMAITATTSEPLPRFLNVSTPLVVANIMACPTNLPSVKIASSANPGYYGQAVTFTATVPTGATGFVKFYIDNASVGSVVPLSNSQAQMTISNLTIGLHTISAAYGGDSAHLASMATPLDFTVIKANTSTALSISTSGTIPRLTATIAVNVPGSGNPTGTVTFAGMAGVGGTSVPVQFNGSSFTATLDVPLQAATVTAFYSGDANFNGSASTPVAFPPASGNCSATTSNDPTLRSQGRAELIGDIVLTCTGTATTNVVVIVPSAPITSRALTHDSPPASEALLMLNEPGIPGFTSPQVACDAASNRALACPAGANVFQGEVTGTNELTFRNIPVTSTIFSNGTPATVLRITGIRIDASGFSNGSAVQAIVALSTFAVNYSEPIVGFTTDALASQVLLPDLSAPVPTGGVPVNACGPLNQPLALNPANPSAPDGVSFVVQLSEKNNFANAFKLRTDPSVAGPGFAPDVNTRPVPKPQNFPGTIYNGETVFYNPAFPTTGGLNTAGLATSATRFLVRFSNVPAGVQIQAPVYENGKGLTDSPVRLVSAGTDGGSLDYTPLGPLSTLNTYYTPGMIYTYEVTAIQNGVSGVAVDTIDLPFYIAYAGPSPLTGGAAGTIAVNVSLGPISNDATPNGTYVPRFKDVSVPMPVATFNAAGCPGLMASGVTLTSSANSVVYGQPVTFTATVTSGATGTVTFSHNGAALGAPVAISSSQAQFTSSTLGVGTSTITATYSGDSRFLPSSSATPVSLTVAQAQTATALTYSPLGVVFSLTATITVKAPGGGSPTGTVTFYNGSTSAGSAALTQGAGPSFKATIRTTTPGSLFAVYSGDANFSGSTSAPVTIPGPGVPTLTLTSSRNPSTVGQSVTFTFTVSPAGAGSRAQLYDGTTLLGSNLLAGGRATFNITTLAAGSHAILAKYFLASSSSPFLAGMVQVVNGASSAVTLTPSLISDSRVKLTATVASAARSGTPTGSVQFVDTGTNALVATATLADGAASVDVDLDEVIPATGTLPIAAFYAGDTAFRGSASLPLFRIENGASYGASAIAPDEIVIAFIDNLANGDAQPGGASVVVTDGSRIARTAAIYGVFASPGQINLVVPEEAAPGPALVTVTAASGASYTTVARIARTAPGIFTVDGSGHGIAAAQVEREADRVFLVVYGTGLRHAANNVTATVNGVGVIVRYVGAQEVYPGLDQIRLELPRSIAGAGAVDVVVSVDGQAANTVSVTLQ